MYSWKADWPLNLWLTAVVLAVFVVVVVGGYMLQRVQVASYANNNRSVWLRVSSLAALRLSGLLILFWMLAGATYTKLIATSADIWFVVDRSASMLQKDEIGESGQSQSRIQHGVDIAESLKSQWQRQTKDARFKYFSIGTQLEQTDERSITNLASKTDSADLDASSRLGSSLNQLMQQASVDQPQAIVVITDGRVTDGIALASVSTAQQSSALAKTFVLAAGKSHDDPFLEIVDINQPSIIFIGDQVQLRVQLRTKNLAGSDVKLELKDSSTDEVVTSATEAVENEESIVAVQLPFKANDAGLQQYQLTAAISTASKPDALIAQRAVALNIRQTALPVLLVADAFSYEVRFLKHFLERTRRQGAQSEPVFAPTFCIRGAERRFVRADPSMVNYLSAEQNWWNQFEACIFVDPAPELLDATLTKTIQTAVVEQGMGLIFVAGRTNSFSAVDSELWKALLPIGQRSVGNRSMMNVRFTNQAQHFGVNLIEELGKFQSSFLPRVTSIGASFQPSATASVLASDQNSLFLLTHFVGAGQVYFQATDESYRWRSLRGSDAIFNTYWSELITSSARSNRLSAGPPTLEVKSTQDRWFVGQSIDLRLDLSGSAVDIGDDIAAISILVQSADHTSSTRCTLTRAAKSSMFRGSIVLSDVGQYSVAFEPQGNSDLKLTLIGTIAVDARPSEAVDRGPNMDDLKDFASKCSGVLVPMGQWKTIVNQLPPQKVLHFEPMRPKSIWNYPLLVALVIGVLGTEWFLRNRWGLV